MMAQLVYRLDMLKEHQTYRLKDGTVVPGVTSILGILDKPGLRYWYKKMAKEGKDPDKVRDKAAELGTITHARIEAWLRGMELDENDITPNQSRASLVGLGQFQEWWRANNLEPEHLELQMACEKFRCGGTADIIAKRPDKNGRGPGRRLLIDIKTGKRIYREAHMQVAAYAEMFQNRMLWTRTIDGMPHPSEWQVDELWIVRVGKMSESDPIETLEVQNREKLVAAFEAVAKLYHALKGVEV